MAKSLAFDPEMQRAVEDAHDRCGLLSPPVGAGVLDMLTAMEVGIEVGMLLARTGTHRHSWRSCWWRAQHCLKRWLRRENGHAKHSGVQPLARRPNGSSRPSRCVLFPQILYTNDDDCQERRVQRVLQRAAQPAVKVKGKPQMVRSSVVVKSGGGARATKHTGSSNHDVDSYMVGPLLL